MAAFFVAVHAAKERKENREPVERVSSRASIFRTAWADCLPSRRRLKARCSVDSGSSRTAIGRGNSALSTHSSVSQRTGAKGGSRAFATESVGDRNAQIADVPVVADNGSNSIRSGPPRALSTRSDSGRGRKGGFWTKEGESRRSRWPIDADCSVNKSDVAARSENVTDVISRVAAATSLSRKGFVGHRAACRRECSGNSLQPSGRRAYLYRG